MEKALVRLTSLLSFVALLGLWTVASTPEFYNSARIAPQFVNPLAIFLITFLFGFPAGVAFTKDGY